VDSPRDAYNYVIGMQTIDASYQFTKEPKLIETARAILAMGSNTLKFSLTPQAVLKPEPRTLAETSERDPAVKAVLEMPFANYLMWVSPLSAPGGGPFAAARLDAERSDLPPSRGCRSNPRRPSATLGRMPRRSWTSSAISRKSLATPII
jgi:hypothetical protein